MFSYQEHLAILFARSHVDRAGVEDLEKDMAHINNLCKSPVFKAVIFKGVEEILIALISAPDPLLTQHS
jgi:hypothetical protein